jgi:NADH dehydrogenase
VSLNDVAEGFVQALDKLATIGKIYEVGGPERVTYDQILDRIAKILGRSAPKLHLPVGLMKLAVSPFEYFRSFPLTKSQINMLLEENIVDPDLFYKELEIEPETLDQMLERALADEIQAGDAKNG